MNSVITGFMGSGKTSVARALARHLNLAMVDLDELITDREGRSPAQLIVEDGEQAFRLRESLALRKLLQMHNAVVIALGGGAWIEETNRALIRQYLFESVWLDAPFDLCWARIEASHDDRPLGKTREQARALYDHRRPIYQLANIHVPVFADDDVDQIVSRITDQFRLILDKL